MAYQPPNMGEYQHAVKVANDAVTENFALRRRIGELEQRLEAVELTPEGLGDLISPDLARLATHYQSLLTAIVDELRARHQDVAEELIEPRVAALEDDLAAAKERAWQEHSRAHELDHENQRLRAALAGAAATADGDTGEASTE